MTYIALHGVTLWPTVCTGGRTRFVIDRSSLGSRCIDNHVRGRQGIMKHVIWWISFCPFNIWADNIDECVCQSRINQWSCGFCIETGSLWFYLRYSWLMLYVAALSKWMSITRDKSNSHHTITIYHINATRLQPVFSGFYCRRHWGLSPGCLVQFCQRY